MQDQMPLQWADYRMGLRRHWKMISLWSVLGLVAGIVLFFMMPATYTAEARVLVRPAPADAGAATGGRTTGLVNLDTEAQVAVSREVAQRVADNPDIDADPTQLTKSISISVPPNSTVLIFRFSADTAAEAKLGANAFAQAYLDNREAVSETLVDDQAAVYSELIAAASADLAATADPVAQQQLIEERASLSAGLQNVLTTAVAPGRVIDEAQSASSATLINPKSLVLGGLFAGILAGLALAFAKIRREDLLATPEELRQLIPGKSALDLAGAELGATANARKLSGLAELISDEAGSGQLSSVAVVAATAEGVAAAAGIRRHLAGLITARGTAVSESAGNRQGAAGASAIQLWSPADVLTSPQTARDVANADGLVFIGVVGEDRRSEIAEAQTLIKTVRGTSPMAVVSVTPDIAANAMRVANDSGAPFAGNSSATANAGLRGVLERPLG